MWKPFLLMLMCCVLVHEGHSASVKTCADDNDCVAGSFCYLQTQRCTPCIDCGAYQRHPASTCAREPAQCGECVIGFFDEILTNGNTRGLCVRVQDPSGLAVATGELPIMNSAGAPWMWISAGIVVAVVSAVGIFVHQKKCGQCLKIQLHTRFHKCNDSQTSLSCAPFAPSAPPQSHAGDAELAARMYDSFCYERSEEKCQQASKFLNPVWVRNNNNNPENEPTGDTVDGPSDPFLIDENTLPSDWTPGTEYDGGAPTGAGVPSTDAPLITSFAGILQLNALATGPSPQPGNHTAGNAHAQNDHQDTNGNSQGQQQQFVSVTNIVINNGAPSATGIFNITQS